MTIHTTWGPITLSLDRGRVIACGLPEHDPAARTPFALTEYPTLDALLAAFPKPRLPDGTDFQRAVWREIATIPKGSTRTYSELAAAIGNPQAARAAGTACGANPLPLFIPCHRVVGANGKLGGYSAGPAWKTLLLQREGWTEGKMK